jgi:F-type H+-transporting ATPase subunit delta
MSEDRLSRDAQLAAELDADARLEQVAAVYAEALIGAAENAGRTEAVLDELDWLVRDVLDVHPGFEGVLASALVSYEEKLGVLDRVFTARVSTLLLNFLKVLSRHGRLGCLRAVHLAAHRRYDELRGRVRVRITTATPLEDTLAAGIQNRLRVMLGAEPIVHRHVDPSLIGGLVVQVGDTVFDGSVANQLERMRQKMIDRSAHEIQSRRNRFRDPAGD